MDEITKQIEAMAEKMEKSTQDPRENLFAAIRSLGSEGLKKKMATLSDDDKSLLKAALEEMTLNKAISFDKEAQSAKVIQGKETDTILQEEIASDDADEKLVKPEASLQHHQGTPAGAWEGTVIKGQKFDKLKNELSEEKGVSDPAGLAAEIGRKKEGKAAFDKKAEEGKKMNKSEVQMMEQHLDEIIEKGMSKCNGDSKMLAKKLEDKGMDKEKVQGAIDKFHGKKMRTDKEEVEKAMSKDEAKNKLMAMEEKEHGTKDPKKLIDKEKEEQKGKAEMKSSMKKAGGEDVLSEEENPEAKKQDGDAPNLQVGGQNRSGVKKEAAPNITDVSQASKDAQKDVDNMNVKMAKSIPWNDPNALLKANTGGRNFNFNVEQFITETLAKGEPQAEEIKKAQKEDVNDLIAKSMDKNWDQVNHERRMQETVAQQNGKLVKSFADNELAAILGLTPEQAKKILG